MNDDTKKRLSRWLRDGMIVLALGVTFVFGLWVGAPDAAEEAATDTATTWTCSMHPQIRLPEPGACPICGMDLIPLEKHKDEPPPDEIAISDRAKTLARIRVAPVTRADTESELRLLGRLEYDETRVRTISPWVGGRIDRLFVSNLGATVQAGKAVASVYSPEAWAAQQDLLSARRQLERLGDAIPAAKRGAEQAVESAEMRLSLLGVSPRSVKTRPSRNVAVVAAYGGTVIEQLVNEGAYVDKGQPILRVADLSRLWAQLDAYESDLTRVQVGQEVSLEIASLPGQTFEGKVAFIDPIVDPMTRTAQIRVEVDNPGGHLSRGMFADAVIHADPSRGAPLTIPRTAPLFTGTRSVVYVEVPDRDLPTYAAREVRLGPLSGSLYPVLEGLREGERVVVSGAFVLDSDLQIRGGRSMMTMPDDLERAAFEPVTVDEAFMQGLAPVMNAYLALHQVLSKDDFAGAQKQYAALGAAVAAFAPERPRRARDAWRSISARLNAEAKRGAESTDIADARRVFERVSLPLMEALRRFGNPLASELELATCPMAIDDRQAAWIQLSHEVENPYHGSSMYRCGTLEEKVPAGAHLMEKGGTP
ncbi:MAG: efflux RND transporter periplasmic adaptor subunit [Polyangiaceae bacterium]